MNTTREVRAHGSLNWAEIARADSPIFGGTLCGDGQGSILLFRGDGLRNFGDWFGGVDSDCSGIGGADQPSCQAQAAQSQSCERSGQRQDWQEVLDRGASGLETIVF